ncbi:hypothetical protein [Porcipelethomonas sp.]|jgi:hypothetical protein|uniref:hypothetical protein n=1 Tax=Porcipelethomonas sp. TaxID=2981675 RepID=UPI000963E965|nr:hypothetical protein [Oscillospiraceae bacterium]OLA00663.1 MAG: hypothetical protein BHV95_02370 [Clostridiales bacterium Nov_37_41]
MQINNKTGTGIVSLKFEKLSELSWEAEGLLTRMVNNPKCDYVTAEILHEMFPADSLETFQQALDELVEKNFVLQQNQKIYSVNKIKMIQEMFYLGSDSEDKEICNV